MQFKHSKNFATRGMEKLVSIECPRMIALVRLRQRHHFEKFRDEFLLENLSNLSSFNFWNIAILIFFVFLLPYYYLRYGSRYKYPWAFIYLLYIMVCLSLMDFDGHSIAGSKGGARDAPPCGPKFFQFHAVLGKIWQNRMLAPPPRGNSGSATAQVRVSGPNFIIFVKIGQIIGWCIL